MRKEDLKDWKRDMLIDEIIRLDIENTDLQKSHINLYNDTKDEIRALKTENKTLKQRLQSLIDVRDGSCFSDYEDLPFGDDEDEKDALIAKLQDQHQQDCIKINQLHVTIDTLVDKYSMLRNTVGMD